MTLALVLNSGSSSIKFQLVDPEKHATDTPFASGLVEQIGEASGRVILKYQGEKSVAEAPIADHSVGLNMAFDLMTEHGCGPNQVEITAVGHRVVHGGTLFSAPELITDDVLAKIKELIPLAPLHNPANIDGIEVARRILPDVPHVAVFDTAFFNSLPQEAALYAIDKKVAQEQGIRRYGFHGTSHEYVSNRVVELIDKPKEEINQITLHLGNGASMSAIRGGQAIDTSMGMTPLAGLVMGTRSGDIDPGIIFHLARNGGMSIDEIDTLLNKQSGIKGITGYNDFRALEEKIAVGDKDALTAYGLYIHQIRRYLGSYMILLGNVDALVFTAGVGENSSTVRADALANLENYGIKIDVERNEQRLDAPHLISTDDSTVQVFVVPTNEELAIARYAVNLAKTR